MHEPGDVGWALQYPDIGEPRTFRPFQDLGVELAKHLQAYMLKIISFGSILLIMNGFIVWLMRRYQIKRL